MKNYLLFILSFLLVAIVTFIAGKSNAYTCKSYIVFYNSNTNTKIGVADNNVVDSKGRLLDLIPKEIVPVDNDVFYQDKDRKIKISVSYYVVGLVAESINDLTKPTEINIPRSVIVHINPHYTYRGFMGVMDKAQTKEEEKSKEKQNNMNKEKLKEELSHE